MIKLFKIGESKTDTFRNDCEYILKPIYRPILKREMWYCDINNSNILYHTDILVKIGDNHLKSKKCKYIIEHLKD